MSETSREARKQALDAAKKRLEERRKERAHLQEQREQRKAGKIQSDYGKKIVEDTLKTINQWKEKPKEPETATTVSSGVPGKRISLTMDDDVNSQNIRKYVPERYTKEVDTDGVEIATDAGIITEETPEDKIDEILLAFMSEEVNAWPPKPKGAKGQGISGAQPGGDGVQQMGDGNVEEKEYESEPEPEPEKPEEPVVMPQADAEKLMGKDTFMESFKKKSLWVQRALGLNDDHIIDYEIRFNRKQEVEQGSVEKVTLKKELFVESLKDRAVTWIDFCETNPDWLLASYSEPLMDSMSAEALPGTVNIWNVVTKQAEYTLEAQSVVTVAKFHPTNPKLVLGATLSGQILAWDIRANRTPISRSEFSSGHSAPVFDMQFLPAGTTKVLNVRSVSNDAKLCMWRDIELVEPQHEIPLRTKEDTNARADEIATTCFSFPLRDTNQVILGSDEGCLYKAEVQRADNNSPAINNKIDKAHDGPISRVQFHPLPSNRRHGDYIPDIYLTSSYDWTVKLWHLKHDTPIMTFEQMQDYVYDVQWSPANASVFAAGDGLGKLTVFNLNVDADVPMVDLKVTDDAVSKIAWGRDGKWLVTGDSKGVLKLFENHQSLYDASDEDWTQFDTKIKRLIEKENEKVIAP